MKQQLQQLIERLNRMRLSTLVSFIAGGLVFLLVSILALSVRADHESRSAWVPIAILWTIIGIPILMFTSPFLAKVMKSLWRKIKPKGKPKEPEKAKEVDKPTERRFAGPPVGIQILMALGFAWAIVAHVWLHLWPQWPIYLGFVLLVLMYAVRWDVKGYKARVGEHPAHSWFGAFFTLAMLGAILVFAGLFFGWFDGKVVQSVPTVNRVINNAVGGELLPSDGSEEGPIVFTTSIPDDIIVSKDGWTAITFPATNAWYESMMIQPGQILEYSIIGRDQVQIRFGKLRRAILTDAPTGKLKPNGLHQPEYVLLSKAPDDRSTDPIVVRLRVQ